MDAKKQSVKLVHKSLLGLNFQQLIQKITHTPTQPAKASVIRAVTEGIEAAQKKVREEYQEKIGKVFHVKDEKGNDVVENGPHGPSHKIIEGKEEEYDKEIAEFEKIEAEVEVGALRLNPIVLSDIKLSANDIKLLGPLYVEQAGPGIPQ